MPQAPQRSQKRDTSQETGNFEELTARNIFMHKYSPSERFSYRIFYKKGTKQQLFSWIISLV